MLTAQCEPALVKGAALEIVTIEEKTHMAEPPIRAVCAVVFARFRGSGFHTDPVTEMPASGNSRSMSASTAGKINPGASLPSPRVKVPAHSFALGMDVVNMLIDSTTLPSVM